jgi:hypothetical protein
MNSTCKNGIITGMAIGLFTIGFFSSVNWLNRKYSFGMQPDSIKGISGLITVLILAIGIYLSMKSVKIRQQGTLTYGQAIKAGITVAIITALITAFFSFIYCTVINPGYQEYMINEAKKAMLAKGESQRDIAQHLVSVQREFSTIAQVLMALIAQSVVGTIISSIMALFIKTKNKTS